jgi:hypothetical protein
LMLAAILGAVSATESPAACHAERERRRPVSDTMHLDSRTRIPSSSGAKWASSIERHRALEHTN